MNNYQFGIKSEVKKTQLTKNKVYPNPTKGNINIELTETSSKIEVTIINVMSQEVSKQQFSNTSIINLNIEGESGVYFLKIVSGGKTENIRVVKL